MASAMVMSGPPTAPIRVVAPGKEWGVEPVELLVQEGVKEVPTQYRRVYTAEEALGRLSLADSLVISNEDLIPVIDLRGWEESQREETVKQVRKACEEWGFFRIVNHGVSLELMERMMMLGKEFMALPVQDKAAYVARPGMIADGYGSKYTLGKDDITRDWRDYLYLHLQPLRVRDYPYWPTKPASFRKTMDEYSGEVKALAGKLLGVISEGLGQREELLAEAIGEPYQKVLFNYYPACPQPDVADGFHQHSDIGALTLVLQETGSPASLQVRHHDHSWVPALPIQGSFVVNVADQVEILTNGKYKSIEHRVVPNLHKSRMSIATFYDAAPDVLISPLKELTQSPIYKQVMFDDHEVAFYEYGANSKNMVQSYIIGDNKHT